MNQPASTTPETNEKRTKRTEAFRLKNARRQQFYNGGNPAHRSARLARRSCGGAFGRQMPTFLSEGTSAS